MSARRLEPRDQIPDRALLDDGIHCHPLLVAQGGDRRALQRRQQTEDPVEIDAADVQHQADAALRLDRRLQQQGHVFELGPLPGVGERGAIGDQLRVRLHYRVEDAQPVGAQRRTGLGRFDNRIGQHRRLDFGGAPGKFDVDAHALPREVGTGDADQLGRNRLAVEIGGRADG